MKKILLILSTVAIPLAANAFDFNIYNNQDLPIVVSVSDAGNSGGVNPLTMPVPPFSYRRFNMTNLDNNNYFTIAVNYNLKLDKDNNYSYGKVCFISLWGAEQSYGSRNFKFDHPVAPGSGDCSGLAGGTISNPSGSCSGSSDVCIHQNPEYDPNRISFFNDEHSPDAPVPDSRSHPYIIINP